MTHWLTILRRIVACAALVVAFPTVGKQPDVHSCAGISVTIHDAGPEAAHICDIAGKALDHLAACHLPQHDPIRIDMVDGTITAAVSCVALYDCETKRLSITAPRHLYEHIPASDPLRAIPESELFASILLHELTHAIYDQQPVRATKGRANHEYMANVMQMTWLSPSSRQHVLAQSAPLANADRHKLNDFIALIDPMRFMAYAWLHHQEHGCDFFADLLSGRESLEMPQF